MKNRFRNNLFYLLAACFFTACNDNVVYHSYLSLRNEGWTKSDTLSFKFHSTDTIPETFRVFAEVRNRCDYPYRDLILYVRENAQDSTIWETDTIHIYLADTTGRWLGKGWGSIYQSSTFIKSIKPIHPRGFTIKVVNGMKDGALKGLNDIGIRIEKNKINN